MIGSVEPWQTVYTLIILTLNLPSQRNDRLLSNGVGHIMCVNEAVLVTNVLNILEAPRYTVTHCLQDTNVSVIKSRTVPYNGGEPGAVDEKSNTICNVDVLLSGVITVPVICL